VLHRNRASRIDDNYLRVGLKGDPPRMLDLLGGSRLFFVDHHHIGHA
jgi:hypothetical protein